MRLAIPTLFLLLLTACQSRDTGDWVTHQRNKDQYPFAALKAQGDDDSPIIAVTCIPTATPEWEAVVTWHRPVSPKHSSTPPYTKTMRLTIQWNDLDPEIQTWEVRGTRDTYLAPMLGEDMTLFMDALRSVESLAITIGADFAHFNVRGLDATLNGITTPCSGPK